MSDESLRAALREYIAHLELDRDAHAEEAEAGATHRFEVAEGRAAMAGEVIAELRRLLGDPPS
jgi:hypothetical protein